MKNNTMNTPVAIPVTKLHPFEGHPYGVQGLGYKFVTGINGST